MEKKSPLVRWCFKSQTQKLHFSICTRGSSSHKVASWALTFVKKEIWVDFNLGVIYNFLNFTMLFITLWAWTSTCQSLLKIYIHGIWLLNLVGINMEKSHGTRNMHEGGLSANAKGVTVRNARPVVLDAVMKRVHHTFRQNMRALLKVGIWEPVMRVGWNKLHDSLPLPHLALN